MAYVIWTRSRDDLRKRYWNRRKRSWEPECSRGCWYPTYRGASSRWDKICAILDVYGFNECGLGYPPSN